MKTNIIIGDPVDHSLSPLLHNAAYEALGIADEFLFEMKRVEATELKNYIKKVRQEQINGLAVTIPHKQAIIEHLEEIDDVARDIGAVNTVIRRGDNLVGYNTDWQGITGAIEEITELNGSTKVALLGTGGSARAIIYAMKRADTQLTIFGRDIEKVIALSKEFVAMPADIDAKQEIAGHDIIINATSVGMTEKTEVELVPGHLLDSDHIVIDIVYSRKTRLLKSAHKAGASTITGLEMLLHQAIPQIELFTGKRPTIETLRKAVDGISNE